MKRLLLASAVASALAAPMAAQAQAPATPSSVTGNMTIASDYRFRGISQTFKGPTIQGGIDYSHSSGLYLGNWNSNVSGLLYNAGPGIEMDFYGGWKHSWGDLGLDLGVLHYYYGDANQKGCDVTCTNFSDNTYNNTELYIGGSWKWLSLKYSHAITNYFGLNGQVGNNFVSQSCAKSATCTFVYNTDVMGDHGDSKGTGYLDLSASFEIAPKLTLGAHAGHLSVKNYGSYLNYTDYKVGLNYDLNGWSLGAAAIGTNAKSDWYYNVGNKNSANFKDLGKTTLVLSVGKTF